ncbi:MAG: hypothetical protein WAM66_03260 [Acidobacteriaceae bacterium]
MRSAKRAVIFMLGLAALTCSSSVAQVNISAVVNQSGFTGDVQSGIAYFAATYHIPVVAECVYNTTRVTIPAGVISASTALTNLLVGTPLQWEEIESAIHIYDPRILSTPHNFLGYTFAWFKVPDGATQFRNTIVERLGNEWYIEPHSPHVISPIGGGIQSSYLDPGKCIPEVLTDVTARELLIKEAAPARYVTIMIYPDVKHLVNKATFEFIARNWFWRSINRPPIAVTVRLH